jgi:hypothetical protein
MPKKPVRGAGVLCLLGIVIAMTPAGYGMDLDAGEPAGEKNVLVINDETFKREKLLKGVEDTCSYAPGV